MKKGGGDDTGARPAAPPSPRDYIEKRMRELDEADSGEADSGEAADGGDGPACKTGPGE